jgi:hypothetical protein
VSPIAKSTPETEKLHQKFGGPEGPPPQIKPTALEKPHPIVEGVEEKIQALGQVPGVIAYGTGAPALLAPAIGAYGLTTTNYINSTIDHYTKGTPLSPGGRDLVWDFVKNYAGYLTMDGITNYAIPWLTGTKTARGTIEANKNLYGEQRKEFLDRAANQIQDVQARVEQQRGKLGESLVDRYHQEVVTGATGATPQTTAKAKAGGADYGPVPNAGIQGPTQDAVIHEKGLRGTYYGIQKRVFEGLGKGYDELLTPELTTTELPTDLAKREQVLQPVADQVTKNAAYRKENYLRYKGDVPKLFVKVKKILRLALDPDEELLDAGGAGNVRIDKPDPVTGKTTSDQVFVMPDGTVRKVKQKPGTIGELYNLLRFARRTAAEAPDKISATAADDIGNGLIQALHNAGMPEDTWLALRAHDAQYRKAILDFPGEVSHGVSAANDRVAIGDQFFSRPDTYRRLVESTANDDERRILKENWGVWATDNPKKVWPTTEQDAIVKATANSKLFPGTPLANPKTLMFDGSQIEMLRNTPAVQNEFRQGMLSVLQDEAEKGAQADKAEAIRLWNKMGPVGAQKIREINAIRDPLQAAKLADDFFGKMDANQLDQLTQQFTYQTVRHRKAYAHLRRPEDVTTGKPAGPGPWMMHLMNKSAMIPAYAATVGLSYGLGHNPAFYEVMLAGTVGIAARESWVGWLTEMMAHPDFAPLQSSLANNNFYRLGTIVMKNKLRTATAKGQLGELFSAPPQPQGTPTPESEPQKTSMNFGPMFNDLERKQATQIATERGRQDPTHIDQVQDLHSQVASGGTPDIHRELASGRLSNEEVIKMVKPAPTDPSAMFANLSLPDALEAFSKGTDDEKSLGLTALAQKIQNEGKNLQPAQRRAVMAQLRRALTSDQAEA